MFRSTLFSLGVLALIITLFVFYWRGQPNIAPPTGPHFVVTTASAPTTDSQLGIGHGSGVWVDSYDDRGRLASQFRAEDYTPQKDGTFRVVQPAARFYMGNGQLVTVAGDTGVVFIDNAGAGNNHNAMMPAQAQSPSRGVLQNVHVGFFPSVHAAHATMEMDVNNLSFDNDTRRLYTQAYPRGDGTEVSGDRVPVTVRGDDYDFDGQGLTIRWNDVDRRLQLLEVAHGGRLVVKHPSKLSSPMSGPATKEPAASAAPSRALTPFPSPPAIINLLQWVNPGLSLVAVAQAAPPISPPTTAPAEVYRATFEDNVRIVQGNQKLAIADLMMVDFLTKSSPGPTTAAAQAVPPLPTVRPAQPSPPAAAAPSPAAAPAPVDPAPLKTPAPVAAGSSPSSSANDPVTILWDGKLRLIPLDDAPLMPLVQGQAAVRLQGSPVVLTPQGAESRAAVVEYRTGDGAVRMKNSDAFPTMELKQDHGLTFSAASLDFDPATSLATILGHSALKVPGNGGNGGDLSASWTEKGVLHFTGKTVRPDGIDHVDLSGHVLVDNAQLHLNSNELALDLEKSRRPAPAVENHAGDSPQVDLKKVTARGDVICRLKNQTQGEQDLNCENLVIETVHGADGKPVPRTVSADGNVVARGPDHQLLKADRLDALLTPKQKAAGNAAPDTGALDLESMHAQSNVHAELKNGVVADGDDLLISNPQGQSLVKLSGNPAIVTDGKGGQMTGPIIAMDPNKSIVAVTGSGTMRSTRSAAGQTSRPMNVAWSDFMKVNGAENSVDVHGKVSAWSTDALGATSKVTGDNAHLDLIDEKTPEKTTNDPAAAGLANKSVKDLVMDGNVDAESSLLASDGTVIRRADLLGSRLTYDLASGRIEVPGAGEMHVEDHRKAEDGGSNARGIMAMKWKNSLVYDQAQRQVTVDGDVVMGFKQEQKGSERMLLQAKLVTLDLVPAPTTAPAAAPGNASPRLVLAHARAEQSVEFSGKDMRLTAHSLDYDPSTQLITIRGSDKEPAHTYDEQGESGTFDEMIWDTHTQEPVNVKGMRGTLRR